MATSEVLGLLYHMLWEETGSSDEVFQLQDLARDAWERGEIANGDYRNFGFACERQWEALLPKYWVVETDTIRIVFQRERPEGHALGPFKYEEDAKEAMP